MIAHKTFVRFMIGFRNVALVGFGVFLIWLLILHWGSGPLVFRYNPYALLSLIAIISNVAVGLLAASKQFTDKSVTWLSAFSFAIVIWATGEFFQRLGATPDTIIFWEKISSFGWIFVSPLLMLFALEYTEFKNPRFFDFAVLFFPVLGLIYLSLSTNLLLVYDPHQIINRFWGLDVPLGPLFRYFLVWLDTVFVAALALLIAHYFQQRHSLERKQAMIFIIAVLVPITIGTFTDGVLPLLNIETLPSGILLTTVTSVMIIVAMYRYRLFFLSPVTVASNILQTMGEAVVVTDKDYTIEFINHRAASLVGKEKDEIVGSYLETLFVSPKAYKEVSSAVSLFTTRTGKMFFDLENVHVKNLNGGKSTNTKLTVGLVTDERGEVAGYVFVFTDVSELLKANIRLQEKVDEVEKLNRLMVGRELKMKEMKAKLAEYERKN